jgi:hypothetical protein
MMMMMMMMMINSHNREGKCPATVLSYQKNVNLMHINQEEEEEDSRPNLHITLQTKCHSWEKRR